MEWDALVKERGMKFFASKIMFNDVLLYRRTAKNILA